MKKLIYITILLISIQFSLHPMDQIINLITIINPLFQPYNELRLTSRIQDEQMQDLLAQDRQQLEFKTQMLRELRSQSQRRQREQQTSEIQLLQRLQIKPFKARHQYISKLKTIRQK